MTESQGPGLCLADRDLIMKIAVCTEDRGFQQLCREILNELLGSSLRLNLYDSSDCPSEADLYIWDYQTDRRLPAFLVRQDPQKHVFVLQQQSLTSLRDELGLDELHVLLKPVSRGALRALFEHTVELHQKTRQTGSGREEELRADRDEILQGLMAANLKLQLYDQERTNFLARALHDFRAPLTAINGYCGLLMDEQFGTLTQDQIEIVQRMQHSAKRLSQMASSMFQLSSCQRVEHRSEAQINDIRRCLDQAMHEMMLPIEDKGIALSLEVVPPPEPLAFERSVIEQVLVNLLENACKFAPRRGSIVIRAYPYFWERRTPGFNNHSSGQDRRVAAVRGYNSYRVDIQDSGPGVPPQHLDQIFEEYTSYSGGNDRSGSGLGLAICRMLVNRQQGRIWAENLPKGAMFSFVLPFYRNGKQFGPESIPRVAEMAG